MTATAWLRACLVATGVCISAAQAHQPHDVVNVVAVSPDFARDGTVLVVSRNLLLRSSSGGDGWQVLRRDLHSPVRSIRMSPGFSSSRRVYAQLRSGALVVSDDAGERWRRINAGPLREPVQAIAVTSDDAVGDALIALDAGGRVWRTGEDLVTWTRDGPGDVPVLALMQSGADVFLHREDGALLTGGASGRWTVAGQLPVDAPARQVAMAADGGLVIGTGRGLLRLEAGGGVTVAGGAPPDPVTALVAVPGTEPFLLATMERSAVWRSDDGGRSWSRIGTGLKTFRQATQYDQPDFFALATAGPDTLFLGSFGGLLRSTDGGHRWEALATLLDDWIVSIDARVDPATGSEHVLVGTYLSGFVHLSDVQTPRPRARSMVIRNERGGPVALVPDPSGGEGLRAFAGAMTGVYTRSQSPPWQRSSLPAFEDNTLRPPTVTWFAPAGDETVFAAHRPLGLLRSDDGGRSFRQVWRPDATVWSVSVSPGFARDGVVFAITDEGLFRSRDGAQSFQLVNDAVDGRGAQVHVSPRFEADRSVYALDRSLLVSRDAGSTWSALDARLDGRRPAGGGFALARDPEGGVRMLLQTRAGPFYRILDDAGTVRIAEVELPHGWMFSQGHGAPRDVGPLIRFSSGGGSNGIVYAASGKDLAMSRDGGESWRPVPFVRRVYPRSKRLRLIGQWQRVRSRVATGGSVHASASPRAGFEFVFDAPGLRWLCSRTEASADVDVQINEGPARRIRLTSDTARHRQVCFEAKGLGAGPHRLRVRRTEDAAGRLVNVDSFDLLPD